MKDKYFGIEYAVLKSVDRINERIRHFIDTAISSSIYE